MDTAIQVLSRELALTESRINDEHGNNKGLIDKKQQIRDAIRWLKQLQDFDVDWQKNRVIKLKDIGFCDYRLLIDDETDNRESWTELSLDETDQNLRLAGGDILILKK